MAHRLGLAGLTNTGKSYSRRTIKEGKDTFIIMPSQKMTHLQVDGKPAKRVDFTIDGKFKFSEMRKAQSDKVILKQLLQNPPEKIELEGNYVVVRTLDELALWSQVIDKVFKNIKTLIQPDFTHYISNIIAGNQFRSRNSGGEAFSRFWDLAADALNAYFLNIDAMRDDLIVVTEFHVNYDEVGRVYKIHVPGGKMLEEKFLPDSYYDVLLYTRVLDADEEPNRKERYKFITKKQEKWNARDGELFEEEMIPNDLQMVLDKYREKNGL